MTASMGPGHSQYTYAGHVAWTLRSGATLRWTPGSWVVILPTGGEVGMGTAPMTMPTAAESDAALERAEAIPC